MTPPRCQPLATTLVSRDTKSCFSGLELGNVLLKHLESSSYMRATWERSGQASAKRMLLDINDQQGGDKEATRRLAEALLYPKV